ncbi:MAG TPA: hypothetical protein VKX28_32470 [Xanthobacteraceae bacterium]|jgi:Tfp pilus assembly protein FimT|nr:hypothetical protein [Xanthobacteraceae bacterium]
MSMKLVIVTAAIVAVFASPSSAQEYARRHQAMHHAAHHARTTVARSSAIGAGFDDSARAAYGRSYDFEGWPTDYLSTRFGDRQMQGRP